MRVLVTGAAGTLGWAVVALLQAQGDEVVGVDKRVADGAGLSLTTDLTDLGQVCGVMAGVEAVVHLAAIPSPRGYPPEVVFRNNVLTDFNVFEAATIVGVRRVVSASSVSALGFPWQHRWSEPLYLPIDEEHPLLPQDAYGLSKAIGEEVAAAYVRRGAGSAACLRFSTIVTSGRYEETIERVRRDPGGASHLLWSYVDLRDAARACLLALQAPFEGCMPLFITAADTTSERPTAELLERYYPQVPLRPLPDSEGIASARWSLLDGRRARAVLDYRPAYEWSRALAEPPLPDVSDHSR